MATSHGRVSTALREISCFGPLAAMPCVDLQYPLGPERTEDELIRLGQMIRSARKAAGLSQEDLAYEAAVDYSTLGEIERGQRNATLRKIIRIASALNTSVAELFAAAEI